MKIVILDKRTVTEGDVSLEAIEQLGEVVSFDFTTPEEMVDHIGDAEAVLCNKTFMKREIMEQCPNLRYIGLFATGYNNVDLIAAKELGIVVCNAPAYSTDAVAQHAFALLLHITNKVSTYNDSVQAGGWIESRTFSYFPYPISELSGMTFGILGFGSIGKKVAGIAKAFGMRVIVYTRTPGQYEGVEYVSEEELFKHSDVLSIHCPLTDATRGFVDASRLAKMKSTAILINTARGPVVNEEDLANALNAGTIAAAGLDVLSHEPMKEDNPLRQAKNCVITPHVAWAPKQTRERLIGIVAENIRQYEAGSPINVVS